MICKNIKGEIDQSSLNPNSDLSKESYRHIAECSECASYYEEVLFRSEIIKKIKDFNPVLNNPKELKLNIMNSIEDIPQAVPVEEIKTNGIIVYRIWFKKIIAAASILLILTFGVEQYQVLNKINLLEKQTQNSQQRNKNIMSKSIEIEILALYNSLEKSEIDSVSGRITFRKKDPQTLMTYARLNQTLWKHRDQKASIIRMVQ